MITYSEMSRIFAKTKNKTFEIMMNELEHKEIELRNFLLFFFFAPKSLSFDIKKKKRNEKTLRERKKFIACY